MKKFLALLAPLVVAMFVASCDDDPMDVPNNAPIANAGEDLTGFTAVPIRLSASATQDIDGDALQFAWRFLNRPLASTDAQIVDPDDRDPNLIADVDGVYTLELEVTDGEKSDTDIVVVTTVDPPPTAVIAGGDRRLELGGSVVLDGGDSFDPEDEALTLLWSVFSPTGSASTLNVLSPTTAELTPLEVGEFEVTLAVSDPAQSGQSASVTVSVLLDLDCDVVPFVLNMGLVPTLGPARVEELSFVNLSGGPITGDLSVTGTGFSLLAGSGPYSLAADESLDFTLQFAPTTSTPGEQSGTLFTGSGVCSDFPLSGVGQVTFGQVQGLMSDAGCGGCHSLSHSFAAGNSNTADPPGSRLLAKANGGTSHSGGTFAGWSPGQFTYELVLAWIEQGVPNN